jgi:threonine/homoserine/homoserine lactone efflux protein
VTIAFLLTSVVIVAMPGPGAIYTIAAGLQRGRRASLVAALGCTLGIVPHVVAAITGLAAVLYASAVAFQTIKYAGVAYLLFLAWQSWRDKTPLTVDSGDSRQAEARPSAGRVISQAVLINLLNPKLTIFFFVFLPQFVHPNEPCALQHMLALSGVFMILTLLVFAAYGIFAAALRHRVLGRPSLVTVIRRVFAGTYLALAGRLALPEH